MLIKKADKNDLKGMENVFRDALHKHYATAGEYYLSEEFVDPNYADEGGPYRSEREFFETLLRELPRKLRNYEGYVAVDNGKIVGYIIGENLRKRHWVYDIVVKKEYQKKGVGKKLVDKLTKGKKNVFCWVNAKNPALGFWKKCGYKEVLREVLLHKP